MDWKVFALLLVVVGLICPVALSEDGEGGEMPKELPPLKDPVLSPDLPAGLYAIFQTTQGDIICLLFEQQAPETVANFVGLAQGTKEWTDLRSREKVKRPFYDGLVFHRVIPAFMIQGGCPLGNGTGGPGYEFKDEIVEDLTFDRAGLLAMANRGPNTNGSQFFITEEPTPHLNGRHTIFGEVADENSLLVVRRIARVARDDRDRPIHPVIIRRVVIARHVPKMPAQEGPAAGE